jgi:hypothetical protein
LVILPLDIELMVLGKLLYSQSNSFVPDSMSDRLKHPILVCKYSHKKGHIKFGCLRLKNKEKRKQKLPVEARFGVVDKESLLCVTDDKVQSEYNWVFRFGICYHVCPNRALFSTYESVDGVCLMGNNITCKIIVKDIIRIKIHDGVVRILNDVKHVPGLKKNLISLATLESIGCKFETSGGVMKVSNGFLVIMKAIRFESLYLLQGSTIGGFASSGLSNLDFKILPRCHEHVLTEEVSVVEENTLRSFVLDLFSKTSPNPGGTWFHTLELTFGF